MSNGMTDLTSALNALADAINAKAGTTGKKTIVDMKMTIDSIPTPSGNQDISTLNEYDVSDKATARVSATERAKIIPENIADGVTILGVEGTHQGGGSQPTLFAPIVTGGVNTISWANDTRNGGFTVTITADVDGTPVTSPLTITEDMDGKTLTITASATDFEDGITTVTLQYTNVSSATKLFVTGTPTKDIVIELRSGVDVNYPIIYDGVSYGGSQHYNPSWLYKPAIDGTDIPLIIGTSNSTPRTIKLWYTKHTTTSFAWNTQTDYSDISEITGRVSIAFYDSQNNLISSETGDASTPTTVVVPSLTAGGTSTMHMVINLEITG